MNNPPLTFAIMDNYNLTTLREIRKNLRDELSDEINKRQAIKAEILYLQSEIKRYDRGDA